MIPKGIYDAILSRCEAAFGLIAARRLAGVRGGTGGRAVAVPLPPISLFPGTDAHIFKF